MTRPPAVAVSEFLQQWRVFWQDLLQGRLAGRTIGRALHRVIVAVFLVGRGFIANRGPTRAAALSYTTLLALVPLLAVMLSVSKNFLKETSVDVVPRLIDRAVDLVAPQLGVMPLPDDADGPPAPGQAQLSSRARAETVARIQSFIDTIDGGALGTIGTVFLVVIAIQLLTTIENAFNDIWGVTRGRSVWRKVVYYWSTITLGPLLLFFAIYLTGRLEYMRHVSAALFATAWLKRVLLNLLPFVTLWLGFTAMYALMPNTRVAGKAALCGGVFAGTLWQLNTLGSTLYISRVVTFSKLYGSLGIIPVFLVGLYFSWLIILLGAQVSFAVHNLNAYLQRHAADRVDQAGRELVACRMMFVAVEHFLHGAKPPSLTVMSQRLQVPTHLLNQILGRLCDVGLLGEVAEAAGGIVPVRAPETVRVADVLRAMRTQPGADQPATNSPDGELVAGAIAELSTVAVKSSANLTFADLVAQQNRKSA